MLTGATEAEFTAFLTSYGFTVASDAVPLLALSKLFMQSLPWCDTNQTDTPQTKTAQMLVAYGMSVEGGGFNPAASTNQGGGSGNIYLKKEKVGPLEQEFAIDTKASATSSSSIGQLKDFPTAYGLIDSLLCESAVVVDGQHTASSVFIV